MLLRIVKMTFVPGEVENFLDLFNTYKNQIRNFPGCEGLDLLQDQENPQVFFTYSSWRSGEYLEAYRKSDLFREIWPKTKAMFAVNAEAWSVDKIVSLP